MVTAAEKGAYMPADAVDSTTARVVVGVDGSHTSVGALAWAAREAALRKAVLEIVHVDFARHEALELFSPDLLTNEKTILDAAVARAKDLEPGIEVTGRNCEPPADEALIEASDGAELLVVGSRGLSLFRQIGMGSVSAACAHHARCPVVIVRAVENT
jgi:nucleotide-binding universal stress UspA family protein